MAQLSLYIQDSMADKLSAAARARNYSVSRYAAQIISEKLNEENEDEARKMRVLKELRGAITDKTIVEPSEIPWETDTLRRFDLL